MSITLVTAASTRSLTSVAAVMRDLGGDAAGLDVLMVDAMIREASAAIESSCQTIFAQQKYTETLDLQRHRVLMLTYRPLVSVTEVSIDGTVITDYRIWSHAAGLLWRQYGWMSYSSNAPEISVTYTGGYRLPEQVSPVEPTGPALPGDLSRATLEVVKIWEAERVPSLRVASKTFGLTGDSIGYRISAQREAIPPLAAALLKPYMQMSLA